MRIRKPIQTCSDLFKKILNRYQRLKTVTCSTCSRKKAYKRNSVCWYGYLYTGLILEVKYANQLIMLKIAEQVEQVRLYRRYNLFKIILNSFEQVEWVKEVRWIKKILMKN